jgi:arsenate reductase-like glutaredoxin family protein
LEVVERDYAHIPLSADELREIFKARDPRDYLNPKSPTYKAMKIGERKLSADEAIALMAREPNLLKRPIVIAGKTIIAGFDRDAYSALGK